MTFEPGDKPRIGISACLLGDEVRFDGGHKRDPFLTDVLAPHVDWVRVCPEVEVGMGTPRETLRLVRQGDEPVRMITTMSGIDHTASMQRWARVRLEQLATENLSGYVLKKDSPSCGMERVKVFGGTGMPRRNGRGVFAEALLSRFPNLPVEEEGRLSDPRPRENFIERVFAYQRLRTFFDSRWTTGALVAFHTAHKMSLLSHSTVAYTALGRLVASASQRPRARVRQEYERRFMETMAIAATTARHTNVLTHMAGHLQKALDSRSKAALLACIDEYRRGLVPLVVPVSLLRHHVQVHDVTYLAGQTYLEPHPRELILRSDTSS
ncbi:MAG: YbgA family protein [Vicinamibacterales bacterium]